MSKLDTHDRYIGPRRVHSKPSMEHLQLNSTRDAETKTAEQRFKEMASAMRTHMSLYHDKSQPHCCYLLYLLKHKDRDNAPEDESLRCAWEMFKLRQAASYPNAIVAQNAAGDKIEQIDSNDQCVLTFATVEIPSAGTAVLDAQTAAMARGVVYDSRSPTVLSHVLNL